MGVVIDRIQLANYRSCKSTTLTPDPRLSALIGPNGSGKSNILHGILLLRKLALLTHPHRDTDEQLSSCRVKVTFNVDRKPLLYDALIKYVTNDRNIDEVVAAKQKWNFKSINKRDSWVDVPMSLPYRGIYFVGKRSQLIMRRDIGHPVEYAVLRTNQIQPRMIEPVLKVLRKVSEFVIGTNYYSASRFTDPSRCPASFEIESGRTPRASLRHHGDHARFMVDLYEAFKEKRTEFQEFSSMVGTEGIGLIDRIDYDEIDVPSNVYQVITGGKVIRKEVKKVLVIPNFFVKGIRLSPNQLSEGTFKTLAVAFYLITDKSRLLLLEEPEVCVHHGLLSSILEIIKSFSRRKQIVISTHSDYVLDALAPENVFLVKRSATKGTTVKRVPEAMSKGEYKALKVYLKESGNLGEYWRHGDLET